MGKEDVLNVANLILSQCNYAQTRDKKGYDIFDATTVRRILRIRDLDDGEVEYLRLKLLRYLKQLKKLGKESGFSEDRIEEACNKIKESVAPYSVICQFRIDKGEWNYSYKELLKHLQSGLIKKGGSNSYQP